MHEASLHPRNSFITLTFDPEHYPGDGGLQVKHWQDFAKRVRKELGPFRFLHCGEYGEENLRPHYHACVFGLDFADGRLCRRAGHQQARPSEILTRLWGQGHTMVGDLTYQSAAYVSRYIVKKQTGLSQERALLRVDPDTGEEVQVKPEYNTASSRPGLGREWIRRYWRDVYPDDYVVIQGKKFQTPRYYDKQMEQIDPAFMEGIKAGRARAAKKRAHDNTPERLYTKARVAGHKWKALGRTL